MALTVVGTLLPTNIAYPASELVPFEGKATLCAVDPYNVREETKGKNTYTYDMVFFYRIETDHDLVNGWEVLTSNSMTIQYGNKFYWGEAILTPDEYVDIAMLIDTFRFKERTDGSLSGTYDGIGELEGVRVHYYLTIDEEATFCDELPPQCGLTIACIPVCEGCPEPFNVPFGYSMSGRVINEPLTIDVPLVENEAIRILPFSRQGLCRTSCVPGTKCESTVN